MIVLRTLLENQVSQNKALTAEHGLSFYIEAGHKKLLFDCSAGQAAWNNAVRMNVPLRDVDYVVLSHSHYDHAGGYPHMVSQGVRAPLVTGRGFFEEKYASDKEKYVYLGCGFSKKLLKENGITRHVCKKEYKLWDGCYAVGGFQRKYGFEKPQKRFVRQTGSGMISDDFQDEICLVLEGKKGLIMVVGCSHPGILNMIETIKKRFEKPIYGVFGGSHLVEADGERLQATLEVFRKMGIAVAGFNHCTGDEAMRGLEKAGEGFSLTHLKSGDCMFLE